MGTVEHIAFASDYTAMTECRHYIVEGRVQGVFFRASARSRALELGLTGWVRNLPDGRVEALACGAPETLDAFHEWLWEGPTEARVTGVDMQPAPEQEAPGEFSIR